MDSSRPISGKRLMRARTIPLYCDNTPCTPFKMNKKERINEDKYTRGLRKRTAKGAREREEVPLNACMLPLGQGTSCLERGDRSCDRLRTPRKTFSSLLYFHLFPRLLTSLAICIFFHLCYIYYLANEQFLFGQK